MTKIKRKYAYTRGRQIWRLLASNTGRLIIEERDMKTREAFYNCVQIDTGKKLFYDFQLEEKLWLGIEAVDNDIIFFHKFASRDMPDHKGIIAFDIDSQRIIWQTEEYIFDFIKEGKIFCYKNNFDGRIFFVIDSLTGRLIDEPGDNLVEVNKLREEAFDSKSFESYLFPEPFDLDDSSFLPMDEIAEQINVEHSIEGKIEFIPFSDIILLNFHERLNDGGLRNRFMAIDILNKKSILEKDLNANSNAFVPDSFFVKDDLLFLLVEKTMLEVYSILIK